MQIVSKRFFDAFQAAVFKSSHKNALDSPKAIATRPQGARSVKKAQMPSPLPSNHEIQRQYDCCGEDARDED